MQLFPKSKMDAAIADSFQTSSAGAAIIATRTKALINTGMVAADSRLNERGDWGYALPCIAQFIAALRLNDIGVSRDRMRGLVAGEPGEFLSETVSWYDAEFDFPLAHWPPREVDACVNDALRGASEEWSLVLDHLRFSGERSPSIVARLVRSDHPLQPEPAYAVGNVHGGGREVVEAFTTEIPIQELMTAAVRRLSEAN